MCTSKPSAPKPPPPPPVAPEPPRMGDPAVQQKRSKAKQRQRNMAGRASTNRTGGLLSDNAATTGGNLLGG